MVDTAFVSRVQIFPIKSLDAAVLREARILTSGALEYDRTWAMLEMSGQFVNGKRHAAVHRLRSSVDVQNQTVSFQDEGERRPVDRTFSLTADRDEIQQWLSRYFGFPVELKSNRDAGFPDDTASPGPTLISVATLQEIARWFDLPLEQVRQRFRTNIEIDGVPPFWEDRLFGAAGMVVRFRIGEAGFEGVNPCQRCVVPTREPASGIGDRTFVRRFTELRGRTLPVWSDRSRFNHFYRVAINTRPFGDQSGKFVRTGDQVRILDT
ncbi:MAG: MOSC N-terminal beta barrel domain-containing protein [Xanthobacteraceae bacterium]|nr:MOSC N-terminal beta barrel domain-containing protein [Xanthobacteraceae bacterium]